jgi:hypothetical protein
MKSEVYTLMEYDAVYVALWICKSVLGEPAASFFRAEYQT